MHIIEFLAAAAAVGVSIANAQSICNPLQAKCDPVPGISANIAVDFTKVTALPSDWTLADSETVSYSTANGLGFALTTKDDAPYIWSSGYMLYGTAEVVLQSAPGIGVITSAVLMSPDEDEIDWEWSGNDYTQTTPTVQTNYFGKGITGSYDRGTSPQFHFNMSTSFNTYTLDWTPDSLTWSVNGVVARSLLKTQCDSGTHQYPQTPSRFQVGVWDGGNPDNEPGVISWAGGVTDLTKFPYTAYVKSVTLKPATLCGSYNFTDMSGSSDSVKCLPVSSSSSSVASSGSSSVAQASHPVVPIGSSTTDSSSGASMSTSDSPSMTTLPAKSGGGNSSAPFPSGNSSSVPSFTTTSSSAPVPASSLTTSTVYTTKIYTVTSCNPTVTNCPANIGKATTEVSILYTTICPVTASEATASHSSAVPTVSSSAQAQSSTMAQGSSSAPGSSVPPPSSFIGTSFVQGSSSAEAVGSSSAPGSSPAQPSSATPSTTSYTTSTVYSTSSSIIDSCEATATDCNVGDVTTVIIAVSTTICPVTAAEATASAPPVGSSPLVASSNAAVGSSFVLPTPAGSSGATGIVSKASSYISSMILGTPAPSQSAPVVINPGQESSTTSAISMPGSSAPADSDMSSTDMAYGSVSATLALPSDEAGPMATTTIYATSVYTITSCAADVTNCPVRTSTSLVSLSTMVVPVTSAQSKAVGESSGDSPESATTNFVTSTLYSTIRYTITSCKPGISDCPVQTASTVVSSTMVVPVVPVVPVTTEGGAAQTGTGASKSTAAANSTKTFAHVTASAPTTTIRGVGLAAVLALSSVMTLAFLYL